MKVVLRIRGEGRKGKEGVYLIGDGRAWRQVTCAERV